MDLFPYTNADGHSEIGVIQASYANFGFVPYGHSMVSNNDYFRLKPVLTWLFITQCRWVNCTTTRVILNYATKLNHKSSKSESKKIFRLKKIGKTKHHL